MAESSRQWARIATGLLVAGAFGLRVWKLGVPSLGYDEAFDLAAAGQGLSALLQLLAGREPYPPLHFLGLRAWVGVAGTSEFGARYWSLLFGVLTIPLVYQLGRLTLGHWSGAAGALIAALNPGLLWYSQEIKMYPAVVALSTCASVCAARLLVASHESKVTSRKSRVESRVEGPESKVTSRRSRVEGHESKVPRLMTRDFRLSTRDSWGYVAVTVAALYMHYAALFVLVFQNLFALTLLGTSERHRLWRWFRLQGVVGLAFLPWLVVAFGLLRSYESAAPAPATPLSLPLRFFQVFTFGYSDEIVNTGEPGWIAGIALLCVAGLVYAVARVSSRAAGPRKDPTPRRAQRALAPAGGEGRVSLPLPVGEGRGEGTQGILGGPSPYPSPQGEGTEARQSPWPQTANCPPLNSGRRGAGALLGAVRSAPSGGLFVAMAFLVPLLLPATVALWRPVFAARHLAVVAPAYCLILGAGLVALARLRPRVAGLGAAVLAIGLAGPPTAGALVRYYGPPIVERTDNRGAVAIIRAGWHEGDLLVFDAPYFLPAVEYYLGSGFSRMGLPIPGESEEDTARRLGEAIERHRRIWLVLWQDYAADPGRWVERWLDRHLDRRQDWRPSSLVLALYEREELTAVPALLESDSEARFGSGARLTHYRIARTGPEEIVVTLTWQADHPIGPNLTVFVHLVDATNRRIGQHDGVPRGSRAATAEWLPGEQIVDSHRLSLPPSAAGEYALLVGLYDAVTGERSPLVDASGRAGADHLRIAPVVLR